MHVFSEAMKAPEWRVSGWLQGGPLTLAGLRGQVVLMDFWDYSCINCLHAVPYLQAWQQHYAAAGLQVVGLHAPEFDFGQDARAVLTAIDRLGMVYPVAQDNAFDTWRAYAVRAWPTLYLIDATGRLRGYQEGAGNPQAVERLLRKLLQEAKPDLTLPAALPVLNPMDEPGAACYQPTPERYCGWGRKPVGNPPGWKRLDEDRWFEAPVRPNPDTLYLSGWWCVEKTRVASLKAEPASLQVSYRAAEVNGVFSAVKKPIRLVIQNDGQPLPPEERGDDVALVDGQTVIEVQAPRLYQLVRHAGFQRHTMSLSVCQPGFQAYTLTFIGCALSPDEDARGTLPAS